MKGKRRKKAERKVIKRRRRSIDNGFLRKMNRRLKFMIGFRVKSNFDCID